MENRTTPHKRFICSFPGCAASYNKQWKLDAHLCKHTGVKPCPCEHPGCGKSFCSPYHLARHGLTHSGLKPFRCSLDGCTEAFATNDARTRHVNRVHAQDHKMYACKFEGCGLQFRKNKQLKSHMCEQHTQQPSYKCTYEGCQMRFTFPSRLKRHEKVHRGYPCQEGGCDFTGKTWTEYLRHKKERHRPLLRCPQCSKEFRNSWFLQQHQRVHSDIRVVLKCPREGCDKSYTTVFNLQNHISSFHEELRPFACEHAGCGKTFAMKCSLQRHSVSHDPERRKLSKPRPKRSLASRLSGYKDAKRKGSGGQKGPAGRAEGPPGAVELASLLKDTSLLCNPAVDTQGLTNALAAPLTV